MLDRVTAFRPPEFALDAPPSADRPVTVVCASADVAENNGYRTRGLQVRDMAEFLFSRHTVDAR
jgi:hypothetical protein